MKTLIQNHPNTVTSLIAILVIASGIAAFLLSLSHNQLTLLLNY